MKPMRVQAIIGKRFIWVHNPKTGGTALADACVKYGVGERLMVPAFKRPERSIGDHLTFTEITHKIDVPSPSMAFVRDPVARLQSFWNFFRKMGSLRTFDEFATLMERTPSQSEYVEGVSLVQRYEDVDLTAYFKVLAKLEGVSLPNTAKVERENVSDSSLDPLTDDQVMQLGHLWMPDAKAFNYA